MKKRNDFEFWNVTKLVCDVTPARQRCVLCLKYKSEEKFMTENHENKGVWPIIEEHRRKEITVVATISARTQNTKQIVNV